MGLLTVPKKYNPPGNGKRDMENLIYATKAEQGLLKARGGSGKMTKHGIRSFGLGDKGNAVGSAGGSNYAGDGMGGQVNLDGVGMGGSSVLRNIAGRWTVVDRATASQIDAGGSAAPIRQKPTVPSYAPVTQPVVTPAIKPAITLPANFMGPASSMSLASPSPQIGGTTPAAVSAAINGSGTSSAWGGSTTNAVSPLGAGNTFGAMAGAGNTPGTAAAGGAGNQTSPTPSGGRTGFGGNAPAPSVSPSGGRTGFGGNAPAPTSPYGGGRTGFSGLASAGGIKYDPNGLQGSIAGNAFGGYPNAQNGAYQGSLPGTSNAAPQAPSFAMDPSVYGRAQQATTNALRNEGVPGGYGMVGYEPNAPQPTPRLAADPTNGIGAYPGAGVPDLPTVHNKQFYDRVDPSLPIENAAVPGQIGSSWTQGIPAPAPTYTPQALNNIRHNNGWIPDPVDAPRPNNGVINAGLAPAGNVHTNWDWSGLGQMDATGQTVTPRSKPSSAAVPGSFGPETPEGPADWQQGGVQVDPTSSTPLDYAKEFAMNTPLAKTVTAISNVLDKVTGGQAYRDAVSNGSESDVRTDRAPSGGGGFSPGSFGPGGGDRRGGNGSGSRGYQPGNTGGRGFQGELTTEDRAAIAALPPAEQQRLSQLAHTNPRQFLAELARIKAANTPTTPPVTPPPTNQTQNWYYPQYQSTWANLPTGLGGTYGRT